jgi:hypothetical protein
MRPFKYKQQELNEKSIPFYSRIGLLSVRFSETESLITHILEKLINSDNDKISYLLIERNVLDKNLDILSLINKQRGCHEEKINKIISDLRSLKETRNFFIHGVWSEIETDKNNLDYIYCADHRWLKVKQIPSYMKGFNGTISTRYKHTKFSLKELDSTIEKSEKILFDLKKVWEDLQGVHYFD